jgi:hypothetical protein
MLSQLPAGKSKIGGKIAKLTKLSSGSKLESIFISKIARLNAKPLYGQSAQLTASVIVSLVHNCPTPGHDQAGSVATFTHDACQPTRLGAGPFSPPRSRKDHSRLSEGVTLIGVGND